MPADHHQDQRQLGGESIGCRFRKAGPADADAVAALHADSWQRHYRGAYPDSFLDGPVLENRRAVWSERLAGGGAVVTIVAEDGDARPVAGDDARRAEGASGLTDHPPVELAGFVHVVLDEDPVWGALVDNLHVRSDRKGGGIGTALLARAAEAVVELRPGSGLFLWVLEANTSAQAFYRARGARFEGTRIAVPPGGGAELVALRCAWPDPHALLSAH